MTVELNDALVVFVNRVRSIEAGQSPGQSIESTHRLTAVFSSARMTSPTGRPSAADCSALTSRSNSWRAATLPWSFAPAAASLTIGELSRRTGLPRITGRRLIVNLVQLGVLSRPRSTCQAVGHVLLGHPTAHEIRTRRSQPWEFPAAVSEARYEAPRWSFGISRARPEHAGDFNRCAKVDPAERHRPVLTAERLHV